MFLIIITNKIVGIRLRILLIFISWLSHSGSNWNFCSYRGGIALWVVLTSLGLEMSENVSSEIKQKCKTVVWKIIWIINQMQILMSALKMLVKELKIKIFYWKETYSIHEKMTLSPLYRKKNT